MSTKVKFGLGSMINKAMISMVRIHGDLRKGRDSAESQGINWYCKRFCTGGKKILECFSFFSNPVALVKAGIQVTIHYAMKWMLGMLFLLSIFSVNHANACSAAQCEWFQLNLVSGPVDTLVDDSDSYDSTVVGYEIKTAAGSLLPKLRYVVSERTNGGNWTDSAEVLSTANRQHYDAVDAEAIQMSIPKSPTGHWYITGAVTHNNNIRYTFVPDKDTVNKITSGNQIEVRIEVKIYDVYETVYRTRYFHIRYNNYGSTTLSWEANNSPHIIPRVASHAGEVDGLVTNKPTFNLPMKLGGYELKPDGTKTLATVGNPLPLTDKYPGWDVPVGLNLQYGSWVVSQDSDKFLFRPKFTEINKLTDSQTVFSVLEVTPTDGNGNAIGDKQTIRVVIGKSQIGVFWDDGTELDDIRNSKFVIAEILNSYTDVTGFMETDFNQILSGGQATSKNKWRFSLFEDTTPETDDDVPPVDEAIVNNPNRKWNTDIVTYGVEEVDELAGTETKVGDAASSGTWYIREADGYTGDNYRAHTSTRQLLFRPNIDVLGEMRDGSSFVSYLRIQKGWCNVMNFPRNTDCSIHNSRFDGEIESATVIAAKVTRQKTFVISINDISLAEGDGSGSTEYAFKVSIDSEAGVPYGFAVPVTFSHGSTNTEDFMTGQDLSSLDVTFDPGDTEETISIMVEKDESEEPDETFELRLSQPTGEAVDKKLVQLFEELGANVGTGTIIDDDRARISINDVTQAEGSDGTTTEFQFTVSLSPATAVNQTFTVPITFEHVSTSPGDFMSDPALATLDVSFGTTDTSKDVSVILVNQDSDGEENERFTLTLSEPTGDAKTMNLVTLSSTPSATVGTGTINNDDTKRLTTTWLAGFDGKIVNDGSNSQYPYQVAYYADDIPSAASYDISERKNGIVINSTPNAQPISERLNLARYPEFTGTNSNVERIAGRTTYGQWYSRRQANGCTVHQNRCFHVLFIPNREAINQLVPGDIVTSTYRRQTWHQRYEASAATVTISADFGSNIIGFDYDSRSIAVAESEESADLDVFISEAMEGPVTISYRVADGTAHSDSDFMPESPATLTIPAGATSATISIPVTDDTAFENTEEFTVHLQDGADFRITPVLQSAKVTVLDDDPPTIVPPGGSVCKVDTKPDGVTTPNTEVYWERGAPEVDGEPVVYRKAYDRFDVRIGFRDHATKAPETPNANNTFYFAVFYDNGEPENPGIPKDAQSTWGGVGHRIGQPGSFRGYLRYRILPRNVTDDSWYYVGDPCEFHIWWTDANRPGITLSADETVKEGRPIRVTATATPVPNRDILVPVSLSANPRIAGERSFTVRIKAGQASGHVDVPTSFMPNDQPTDEVTATAEWRSTYWLDDTRKSATVSLEDHDQRFVSFKNSDPDIEVVESETAVLPVSFVGTNSSGVTVKYRIDDVDTDSMDYTAVANPEVTIATGNEGMISIPISADMEFEDSESFTVTIIESDDALPGNSNFVATVTVISDDGASPTLPRGEKCDDVEKPETTSIINTQAFWEEPLPDIYQESNGDFTAFMKFRDPITKAEGNMKLATTFKIATYYLNGSVETPDIESTPSNVTNRLGFPLKGPRDHTGYLGYRIEESSLTDDNWYDIGEPCEFRIWWTDAGKPGVSIEVDKKFVVEGSSFRVTATATPAPNRDIVVPVTLSDTSRITDLRDFTVRIAAGQPSGYADIRTRVIPGDQPGDDLTVSAEWRSTYWMDETVSSRNITLTELKPPELSIRAAGAVTEANFFAATFTVTADIDPADAVEVHYTPTETGDFLVAPVPDLANRTNNGHLSGRMTTATLNFTDQSAAQDGSGPFEAPLTVPLRGNSVADAQAHSVTVTLNTDAEGADYGVSAAGPRAAVTIIDDETLPVLTLEPDSNPADFDEPAAPGFLTFKVTASAMPRDNDPDEDGAQIDVRFTPAQTGDFVNDQTESIALGEPNVLTLSFADDNGVVTADLAIPILADDIEEPSGSVSVTLLPADVPEFYYVLSGDAAKSAHRIKVYDDDETELSVSVAGTHFVEGSEFAIPFAVTSRFTVDSPLTVNFKVEEFEPAASGTPADAPSEQNEFLGAVASPETMDFSSSTAQSLGIPIVNDEIPEPANRFVRVTLLPGADYTVADADAGGSATILVVDNDAKPLISLSAAASAVESDGRIEFTVSALVDPGTIRVNFKITVVSEDYLLPSETARTSELLTLLDADSDGTYTAAIMVFLDDDGIAERTGVIAMSLAANTADYNLGTATIATVNVYDDDAPELTIAGGGAVTEGNPGDAVAASFIVESQALPNEGESDEGKLTVLYTPVSDSFLAAGVSGAGASANLSFTDASGAGDGPYRAELSVAIDNDEEEEENGTVQVFLQDEPSSGTSYFVAGIATNMHFASVAVIDNDSVVVLSVADASGAEGTAEDGYVEFTVTASKRIPSGFTAEWVVNTGSALGTADPADLAVASLPHTGTVTFAVSAADDLTPESVPVRIPLAADDQDEGEETFTLTLTRATGTGATEVVVSRTRGSATGTIRNDDGQSVAVDEIVIDVPSVVRAYENAGEARIVLTLNATPAEAFTVTASAVEIPAGTVAPNQRATAGIDFIPYAGREFATSGAGATVSVKLVADSLPEGNEKFMVEISTASNAAIAGANAGTKRVEVVIVDESQVPVVEVTAQRRNILEGNAAEFAVVASSAGIPGQVFEVPIRVTQTGDYLAFPAVETIAVSAQARVLRFATANDSEVESNGIVTLTLLEGTGYRLHTQRHTDYVNVVDNDGIASGRDTLYSVVSSVITEILRNLPPTNPSDPAGEPDGIIVSVSAVEKTVSEGDPIRIAVSIHPVSDANIEVMLMLEETGYYLGETSDLTVLVPAGSSTVIHEIPTVNDELAEDSGLVTVSILQSEAYSIGSRSSAEILVTDEEDNAARREQLADVNRAVLPEFAGSIGAGSHVAMSYRMSQAFSDAADPAYQLGGQSSLSGLLTSGGRILNGEDVSWEEVLGDTSFSLDLLPETNGVKTASVWGIGDFRNLSGGDAFTGHVGVDTLLGKGIAAGIMTSASSAELKFGQGTDEVKYRIRTTGVQPYFGLRSEDGDDRLDVVAGYGLGEAVLNQASYDLETFQTTYYNAGLSGSGRLYSYDGFLGGAGQLSVEGDSWFARQFLQSRDGVMEGIRTDAGHARLALQGSQEFELETGASFGPNASIGLRADEKGGRSFVGMELLVGLQYRNPLGLTLAGDAVAVASDGVEVRELELAGTADFDRDRDGRGLLLSIAPEWGQIYSESDGTLWSAGLLSESGRMGIGGEGRSVSAEIGYGLDLGREIGRLTPYAGLNASDGTRRYNLGSRLGFNSTADLQLEFSSRSPSEGESAANLMLDGTVRW